jgi:hypothetical protein
MQSRLLPAEFEANHLLGKMRQKIEKQENTELFKTIQLPLDPEVVAKRIRVTKLAQRILASQVFSLISRFLDFNQAIALQQLNKMMYYRKVPQMFGCVYGSRIEPCIVVYSVYKDRKNAVSVIVGKVGDPVADTVSNFLHHHPSFSQKYKYLDVCWPCMERKDLLVAVFKYAHDRYIEVKPRNLFYSKTIPPNERGEHLKHWVRTEQELKHW